MTDYGLTEGVSHNSYSQGIWILAGKTSHTILQAVVVGKWKKRRIMGKCKEKEERIKKVRVIEKREVGRKKFSLWSPLCFREKHISHLYESCDVRWKIWPELS